MTQELNPYLISPALAGRCFTTSATKSHALKETHPHTQKKVGEKGRKEVVLIRKAVESQGPSVAPSSPEPVRGEALG